jgi:predicted dinucleotide-binding enzyme
MKIALIGTTDHGKGIAELLASTGHEITISDPYAQDRAAPTAADIDDATAETAYRQAATSDILILATRWDDIERVITAIGRLPDSAVVVDATKPKHPGPRSGAEMLSQLLNTHRVVEAFTATPESGSTVPLCGDDPEAKEIVADLIRSMGCVPDDRGTLQAAAQIEQSVA